MCNFTCLFFKKCLPSVSFLSPNCLLPFDKMVAVKKGRLIRKHDEREVLTFMMKRLFAYGGGQRPLVRSRTAAVRSE